MVKGAENGNTTVSKVFFTHKVVICKHVLVHCTLDHGFVGPENFTCVCSQGTCRNAPQHGNTTPCVKRTSHDIIHRIHVRNKIATGKKVVSVLCLSL